MRLRKHILYRYYGFGLITIELNKIYKELSFLLINKLYLV